jgi:hypothetical protein
VILQKGLLDPMVISLLQLLEHLPLLIGNMAYVSDHLLEAGIVIVLALQGPNLCPLWPLGCLLVERKIDCKTISNRSGGDQDSWQLLHVVKHLPIAPCEVVFIMGVPVLASGGRYLISFDIW